LPPQPIPPQDRLIVALDVSNADEARAFVERLGDAATFYKAGLELCTAGGYFELIDWLVGQGKKVFADLKLYDVPETVRRAVRQLAQRPITFTTVHGNDGILEAAASEKGKLQILAVTVLTSLDQKDLEQMGISVPLSDLVLARAKRAQELGCDGIIASPLEARRVREGLGEGGAGLKIVTPGIRPADPAGDRPKDDQKRVATPTDAFQAGADYIVVGRPIRDAQDPRAAALAVQGEIRAVFG
jgi:orotidine-5'-phosphate decarboxylase